MSTFFFKLIYLRIYLWWWFHSSSLFWPSLSKLSFKHFTHTEKVTFAPCSSSWDALPQEATLGYKLLSMKHHWSLLSSRHQHPKKSLLYFSVLSIQYFCKVWSLVLKAGVFWSKFSFSEILSSKWNDGILKIFIGIWFTYYTMQSKYTIQWPLVYSQVLCNHYHNFQTFSLPKKESSHPLAVTL